MLILNNAIQVSNFVEEIFDLYNSLDSTLKNVVKEYYARVLDTEYALSYLVNYLYENDILDKTIISFTGDHESFSNGIGAFVTSNGEKLNEKAVSLHLLEDLLGWIAVLITSVIMKIFDVSILDPILSIGITIYILWHVIQNYKRIFGIYW